MFRYNYRWLEASSSFVNETQFLLTRDAVQQFRITEGPQLQKHLQKRLVFVYNFFLTKRNNPNKFLTYIYLFFNSRNDLKSLKVHQIGRRIADLTGDPRSASFLDQQIDVALQKGNAASIFGNYSPSLKVEGIII